MTARSGGSSHNKALAICCEADYAPRRFGLNARAAARLLFPRAKWPKLLIAESEVTRAYRFEVQ